MKHIVIQQVLAISVVPLQEEILIGAIPGAPVQFQYGIEIQIPAATFDKMQASSQFAVPAQHAHAALEQTYIIQYVPIIFSVYYRYPEFAVYAYKFIYQNRRAERDPVP